MPNSLPQLEEMMRSLKDYFTHHSDHENPAVSVTAENIGQHLTTLKNAIKAVNDAKTDQRSKRDARNTAEQDLIEKMRVLEGELNVILKPTDPRWLDFMEDIPGDPQRPEAVEGLEVEGGKPGQLFAEWEPSLRAERYQVDIQVAGQDAEFRRVATVRDTNVELNSLPPGAQVKVRVIAANDAGEAAPSEPVEVQVPALAKVA